MESVAKLFKEEKRNTLDCSGKKKYPDGSRERGMEGGRDTGIGEEGEGRGRKEAGATTSFS